MKSLTIAMTKVKGILFSPSTVVTMFMLPLFFIYMLGAIYAPQEATGGIPIVIVDEDYSEYTSFLISLLEEEEVLSVEITGEEEAIQLVQDNKVEGAYIIKAGFEDAIRRDGTPKIEVVKSTVAHGADAIIEIIASGVVRLQSNARAANIVVNEYHQRGLVEEKDVLWQEVFDKAESYWYPEQLMQLDYTSVHYGTMSREEVNFIGFSEGPIGIILTFLPLFLGFGLTGVLKERQEGVLKRLWLICESPTPILLGNFLAMVLLGGMQAGVLLLGEYLFFNTVTSLSIGYSMMLFFSYIALFSAIILYVASFIKKDVGVQGTYSIAIIITSMIGGCFWSMDILPRFLRSISLLTPQGVAMAAFHAGNMGNLFEMWIYNGLMLAMTVFILWIAHRKFYHVLR